VSLKELEGRYKGDALFQAGSLVELLGAYNALIECAGGIHPGDNAGDPGRRSEVVSLALAIMKRSGAGKVILVEPEESRAKLGVQLGAIW